MGTSREAGRRHDRHGGWLHPLLVLCLVAGLCAWGCAEGETDEPDGGRADTGGRPDAGSDTRAPGYCGDGVIDPGEECDDGNTFGGDRCSSTCTVTAVCGNHSLDRGEQCDDGNTTDGDGCSSTCEVESGGGAVCGNSIAERGEQCDGGDLGGETCQSQGFTGGILTCTAACKFDVSRCLSGTGCGNGAIDGDEECDGANLNRTTCGDLGFDGGTLGCTGRCTFDTSFCTRESGTCGDGNVDMGEVCDGRNLAGETCESLGFAGGTLACRADCNGFDKGECVSGARCGDGVANGDEDCDGSDLRHETCETLGFVRGTLACSATCTFDKRRCESGAGHCGNGTIDAGESCDGTSLGGESCESQGFDGGTLACAADCLSFDTRGCSSAEVPAAWTCDPGYYGSDDGCDCGCGAVDPDCDDNTVASCEYCGGEGSCNVGPCPGTIKPTNNATCDSSVGVCGDGVIGSGEACDGENLGGETCESRGFTGGTLACGVNCRSFDTSGCEGAAEVPAEWTCDASFYGTDDGCDCGCGVVDPDCANDGIEVCVFCDAEGSCSATDCPGTINPENNATCVAAGSCGDGVVGAGETCDGAALGDATCESLGFSGGSLACKPDCTGYDTSGCEGGGEVPAAWTCSDVWYGDGIDCDCGCGAFDPDCDDATLSSCDYCADTGSCNTLACPGTIDPASNWQCSGGGGENCGNGAVDPGERCDGSNYGGETCVSLGYTGGTLACAANCLAFDTAGCTGSTVPDGWSCDPTYYDASDGCDCECGAYDPDCDDPGATVWNCYEGDSCDSDGHCVSGGGTCGNGVVDTGETCDGTNLGAATCGSLGFTGGTLACAANCRSYDTSGCIGSTVPGSWTCDPTYYNAADGCDCDCGAYDPDCDDPDTPLYGCSAGETCDSSGNCVGGGGDCGNGTIDAGEACDGANLGGETFSSQGFTGGTLACAANCLTFNTSGCTGGSLPPGWTCSESYYDDGEYCDCDCGAYDSDCDNATLPVYGCAAGQTCNSSGECVGESTVPDGWTCDPIYYGSNDGCDCECGVYDPDCDDPTATVWNCLAGQTCDTSGTCVGNSSGCGNGAIDAGEVCDGTNLNGETCTSRGFTGGTLACGANCLSFDTSGCTGGGVPPGWTCDAAYYADGAGCDCECGAYDPDCADPEQPIYNCYEGQTCDASGSCVGGGGGEVPAEWTCNEAWYNDATYCDCECGAYDPDCSDSSIPVDGCAEGQTCDSSGHCTGGGGGGVPAGWTCDETFYNASDGCDCECGAYDLDCDDPGQEIYNCDAGETCDSSGNCTGGGGGVPPGWSCDDAYYNDGAGCDCECGAYDPDCDDPEQPVYNCYEGQICNSSGLCEDG